MKILIIKILHLSYSHSLKTVGDYKNGIKPDWEEQVVDWNTMEKAKQYPDGEKVFEFKNFKDKTDQAVQTDGSGIIIINDFKGKIPKFVEKLKEIEIEIQKAKNGKFSLKGTIRALENAYIKILQKGLDTLGKKNKELDVYNSNTTYLSDKLTQIPNGKYVRMTEKNIAYEALKDGFLDNDTGASSGNRTGQPYKKGDFIVVKDEKKVDSEETVKTWTKVDRNVFFKTYIVLPGEEEKLKKEEPKVQQNPKDLGQ